MFIKDNNFIDEKRFPVLHGFFTRKGGVSEGVYSALNCSFQSRDKPAHVKENRARVAAELNVEDGFLLTLNQVHSARCVVVKEPLPDTVVMDADALVTDLSGVALGALSADCAPVLFYGEKENGTPVIGAAHAGWGGALKGVLEETVSSMISVGALLETVRACVGPCIGAESYEVSSDFSVPFLEQDEGNAHFFRSSRKEKHMLFDLSGYAMRRLALSGVSHISGTGHDTYGAPDMFFSYRRALLAGEIDYGRQISAISINL